MKYYLIRIQDKGKLKWAYIASDSNSKSAYNRAKELFGKNLLAFETAPIVHRKPDRETFR